MEEKIYKCPECGKESKDSEIVVRRRDMVSCLGCGHIFVPKPKK